MKKIAFILMTAILLAGGAVAVMSAPSYAQVYEYPPPPQDPYESPWVGPDTPWVYYNGDWFLNGILYYFSALNTVGLHITLMIPAILSDPKPGMVPDGWGGIRGSLNTGRVFSGGILIGVHTARASIIISNFLNNTIRARALGGRKDSKAAPLLHPVPKDANPVRLKRSPLKRSNLLDSTSNSLSTATQQQHLLCSMSLNHNNSTLLCSMNNNHNSSTLP